jgi:hypothetical protein
VLVVPQAPTRMPVLTYGVSFGGSGADSVISYDGLALEPATGAIYIGGQFGSSSFRMGATNLTNIGITDAWIAKLNRTGGAAWARHFGGVRDDSVNSVRADSSGNCYVSGSYASPTLTVGSIVLTNTVTTGQYDVFVTKLAASTGTPQWAQTIGGTLFDGGHSVAVDSSSAALYVAFETKSSTITIATTPSTTLTNANSGGTTLDVGLVKLNSTTGAFLWAQIWGGSMNDYPRGMTTDSNGFVYLCGEFFSSSITFGAVTLTNTGTTSSADAYLVKLTSTGSIVWARQWGSSTGTDRLYDIVVSRCLGQCAF